MIVDYDNLMHESLHFSMIVLRTSTTVICKSLNLTQHILKCLHTVEGNPRFHYATGIFTTMILKVHCRNKHVINENRLSKLHVMTATVVSSNMQGTWNWRLTVIKYIILIVLAFNVLAKHGWLLLPHSSFTEIPAVACLIVWRHIYQTVFLLQWCLRSYPVFLWFGFFFSDYRRSNFSTWTPSFI